MGTICQEIHYALLSFLRIVRQCTGQRVERAALRMLTSISPAEPFPWNTHSNKEEITLPGTAVDICRVGLRCRACNLSITFSVTGSGILT
jgi:hypothetical protein